MTGPSMTHDKELSTSAASSLGGRQAGTKLDPHLSSHGHLNHNNIHLRNLYLMQRQRVLTEARNPSELPFVKELTILRRARSLRDPSTSPAWSNSSYGSRRLQGNIKRDEMKGGAGSKCRREAKKQVSRREKLDLRPGGNRWAGDFLGEEAADLESASCPGSDQKENRVLRSNGVRDGYQVLVGSERKPKSSKATGKKGGRRLEKSRSYPWVVNVLKNEQQQPHGSQRLPSRSVNDGHLDGEDIADGSNVGGRILSEDERLQRGSIRVLEDGYVEGPERRAEIARRVISENSNGGALLRVDSVGLGRLPSPIFTPIASLASARARRDHLDLLSVMNSTRHSDEREEAEGCGDTGGEQEEDVLEEEEDEAALALGVDEITRGSSLKLPRSSFSSHTDSPLLYRDSLTTVQSGRSTPRARRKAGKMSGHRDGERRHREGINVRVAGKSQGRLRGRRTGLRSSLSSTSNAGSSFHTMAGELEVSELPRNGCGIPWYWAKMHKYRGKRFLDIAGRSLACGFAEGATKRKDESHSSQSRSNSHGEQLAQCNHNPLSLEMHFGGMSSDCDDPSRNFEIHEGEASPDIPRADGNLLTADRSGELLFGSSREELSGVLVTTSPDALSDESPSLPPLMTGSSEEPNRSLSQKYRPRSFSELVGQSLVTRSLSTAVMKGKVAPLYLFQGPRGTGKTSTARIFAQALNCVSDDIETPRPCRFCAECIKSSPDITECDVSTTIGVDSVEALIGCIFSTPSTSRIKVVIIDDCHCLSVDTWSSFLKALEKVPWHVVFILITTDAEKVPRTALSRCQKFLFSKIKEAEIVTRLQGLAVMEGLEVEKSAISLVAARSQGSIRDAETVLDQLSLLGKKVSLSMVQEMVGLVSDEKMIELLDLAMSAEAVSTVRCIRDLLDGGVEPLALVSQLATLITDILAGTYVISREQLNRGFFFRRNCEWVDLSLPLIEASKKEEAVRLRLALKILSEAEKQLRLSSDQPTWLTAALLQFAPDRSLQPSSLETSVVASPVAGFHDTSEKETGDSIQPWTSGEPMQPPAETSKRERVSGREQQRSSSQYREKRKKKGLTSNYAEAKIYPAESPVICQVGGPHDRAPGRPSNARSDTPLLPRTMDDLNQRNFTVMSNRKVEEVWQRVLHGSRSNVLRQLLQGQGKLLSLLLSNAFAVAHLEFRHPEHKARAERSRSRICNAFQMALGCPVELQISLGCMSGEHQAGFTSFEDQQLPQTIDNWYKERAKVVIATPDQRSYDLKSSGQNRRRQRGTRVQRQHTESIDVPQSLYNAVMGDSKGFKPEILPVVSSNRRGRQGEEDRSERPRETRTLPPPREDMDKARIRYANAFAARADPGRIALRTAIHQFDEAHPRRDVTADVNCGSTSRNRNVKFRDVKSGQTPNFERDSLRLESRLHPNPSQIESRLLCWRVQKIDEEKIRVQRRRRQRRQRLLLKIVPCAKTHPSVQQQQAQSSPLIHSKIP